jgi:uncharacterized protein YdeI (YjbR/CyaY-like superfamily)
MTKSQANPKVDAFFTRAKQWREEMESLRTILLDCGLAEDLKWGKPCYSLAGGNVIVIQGFKAYCALLFFKGVLMPDPHHLLVKTGENTRVGRQLRFTSVEAISESQAKVKYYIQTAIALEKSGVKVELPHEADIKVPGEFEKALAENPALKKAFKALTPGRQRGYYFYFSQAKQSKTRTARIEKCVQRILDGKGMMD